MANTYSQIHIHFVAAVKFRKSLIGKEWKERLHGYITGIVQNNGHKMVKINSVPDHIHFLLGLSPTQSISDLMEKVKGESSEWIIKQKLSKHQFKWQSGYGAFSYSKSQLSSVISYIENQEIYHHKKCFLDEYQELLKTFGISFKDELIFKELEDLNR